MFRLVGVGSRPDLLAVVVCAKSTKLAVLAVTLAQGGGDMGGNTGRRYTSSGPLLAEPSPSTSRADLHWRAPSQWPEVAAENSAIIVGFCRLNRRNKPPLASRTASRALSRRGLTPCVVAAWEPVQATNDLRPALRSETPALRPRLAENRS